MRISSLILILTAVLILASCTKKNEKPEIWIYTSIYKDTVADLQPKLEAKFPAYKFNFFQAGSEEIAAKVNAEEMAGGTKADILIFSDRFYFEEMANRGRFEKLTSLQVAKVPVSMKNKDGFYAAVSLPIMVMIYNTDAVPESKAPKSFKEMSGPAWKGKFTTGSPLASGTNFTTVAFLQKSYGWEWFKALRANDTISEGGNSSVIRRVQTKERPVGWVLLENALRLQETDKKIKVVYPDDGVILQNNAMAVVKKSADRGPAQLTADWFLGSEAQDSMVSAGLMYASIPGKPAPKGAPELSEILKKSHEWDQPTIDEFMKNRESIKEEFAKIMLQ